MIHPTPGRDRPAKHFLSLTEGREERFAIRVATPDDHSAVSELFEASYSVLLQGHYQRAELEAALPLLTRANPMLLASGTFFVANSVQASVVGCGGWTRERPGKGDTDSRLAHIRHFAIDPGYTRRGIGRALYEACETQARRAGIERFECYASLNAEGFYVALGFERIETIDLELAGGKTLPAVWMTRSI